MNIEIGNAGNVGVIIFIIFLILKLCHVINWSWWWVTAPLWVGPLIAIIGLVTIWLFLKYWRKSDEI